MTKISTQGEKENGWVKVNSEADVLLHYLFQSERISGRTKKQSLSLTYHKHHLVSPFIHHWHIHWFWVRIRFYYQLTYMLYTVLLVTEDAKDISSAIRIGAQKSLAANTSETTYRIRTFSSYS